MQLEELLAAELLSTLNQELLIIGKDVETSARSPKLWNAVLSACDSPTRMIPVNLELTTAQELGHFLHARSKFIGCAIGFPNKLLSAQFIRYEHSNSGINVLRKKGLSYEGFNSDGVAALHALQQILVKSNTSIKKILIVGTGSTANSFYAALKSEDSELRSFEVLFFSRTHNRESGGRVTSDTIDVEHFLSAGPVVIINATPNGSASKPNVSPISEHLIELAHRESVVFDFNYNTPGSLFRNLVVSREMDFNDGLSMNLFQAVLSFEFVFEGLKIPKRDELLSIMAGVV